MSDEYLRTTHTAWIAKSFCLSGALQKADQLCKIIKRKASQGLLGSLVFLLISLPVPVSAANIDLPETRLASAGAGPPLHQQFLENGASVVRTIGSTYCVVSRRIDIAASEYRDADGAAVSFDQIIRSPATSIQVMDTPDGNFNLRVQMKYSPDPDAGVFLTIGTAKLDVAEFLEPSADSLRFKEELAGRLVAALRDGVRVQLLAQSRATGRLIKDTLEAPDLAALDACRIDIATRPETPLPPLARQISLDFDVSNDPSSRATLEDYRACGMTPTDEPLHLGKIRQTSGFFTHTSKVFVSFDENGRLDRVYVPGLLDAGFSGKSIGDASVSKSADQNIPNAQNAVTGCIGASDMALCDVSATEGTKYRLQACGALPTVDNLADLEGYLPPEVSVPELDTAIPLVTAFAIASPSDGGMPLTEAMPFSELLPLGRSASSSAELNESEPSRDGFGDLQGSGSQLIGSTDKTGATPVIFEIGQLAPGDTQLSDNYEFTAEIFSGDLYNGLLSNNESDFVTIDSLLFTDVTSVTLSTSQAQNLQIDDIGASVVPLPGAAGLLLLGIGCLFATRRRHSY